MQVSIEKPQIVICGSIAIDRIMNFSGRYRDLIQPEKLHVLSISTLIDKLEDSPGGVGANISYHLAQLGDTPALIGSVGQDGKGYIDQLSSRGVDVSNIHFSNQPTASFNVLTDSEDSQVGGFFQGAMSDSETVSFKPWQGKNVLAVLSAHNPEAMNRQIEECKSLGIRLVFDPGQQVSDATVDLGAGVEVSEILFVNDYEQGALCKKIGITPLELASRVPIVVITLGKEGSVIEGGSVGTPIQIGVAKISEVVDPTGAGDAYRAGFLYGYTRQWDLKKCGQFGATVASFIVEHHGTQSYLSKQAIIDRYKESFNEEIGF